MRVAFNIHEMRPATFAIAQLEKNNFALKNLKQIKGKRSIISRLRRKHSSTGVEILLTKNEGLLVV